jgi:hypothetical protein
LKNHTDYVQAPSHVALRGIITLDPPPRANMTCYTYP